MNEIGVGSSNICDSGVERTGGADEGRAAIVGFFPIWREEKSAAWCVDVESFGGVIRIIFEGQSGVWRQNF